MILALGNVKTGITKLGLSCKNQVKSISRRENSLYKDPKARIKLYSNYRHKDRVHDSGDLKTSRLGVSHTKPL